MNQDRSIITLAYAIAMTAIVVSMIPSSISDKALDVLDGRASQMSFMAAMALAPVAPIASHSDASCPKINLARAQARFVRSQVKLQAKMAELHAAHPMWTTHVTAPPEDSDSMGR